MRKEKSPAANRAGMGDEAGRASNPIVAQQDTTNNPANLLEEALRYAQKGYAVIPLHTPLFEHPLGYLCSCEHWRHSEECRQRYPRLYLRPDKHCPTPGKHPRLSRWKKKATTDPGTIRKWWRQWPDANIGIACGPSGLLVLDADTYKEHYSGDSLLRTMDEETVTVLTGGGGAHLWYRRPDGKEWGNGTKGLPDGIDIRGVGGLVVAPPSLHVSGRRYTFELGYSLEDMPPLPAPDALSKILDRAHEKRKAAAVAFAQDLPRPDLGRWHLSEHVLDTITNVRPRGQRSEADFAVCAALARAGATNDEIRAVFQHYPIGVEGKYAERGDGYLARTIGKARAEAARDPTPEGVKSLVNWCKTTSFADHVPQELQCSRGYRTDGTDTKLAVALLELVEEKRSWTVRAGLRTLALRAGLGSPQTVANALERLDGWFVERLDDGLLHVRGEDLLGTVARRLDTSHNTSPVESVQSTRDVDTYRVRKGDDPFLVGLSRTAKALKNDLPGLGEGILRVVDALERLGEATRAELCAVTGKTSSAVARATRRAEVLGLLEADQEHAWAPKVYRLAPDWAAVVEHLRPRMKTYMASMERAERFAAQTQEHLAREAKRTKDPEKAKRLERAQARLASERMALVQGLHPEWSREEVLRWVLTPSTPRVPSAAVLEERRVKRQEVLIARASGLLDRRFLTGHELVKLRHTLGRLGENPDEWFALDDAEGLAFAYGKQQEQAA